jgi:hypothetical protein
VVTFVLIGFYSYPFVTILFGKWPVRPSDLPQPQAGYEIGWTSLPTLFFYGRPFLLAHDLVMYAVLRPGVRGGEIW